MSKEISLEKIISAIKNNLVIILIVSVVSAVVMGIYTKVTVVPRYSSVIEFCLSADIEKQGTTSANERNEFQLANELMSTCIGAFSTGDAYDELNQNLYTINQAYEKIALTGNNVVIRQGDQTSNLFRVVITTTNPQLSYDACFAFEEMAKQRVTKVGKLKIERMDSPDVATQPISSGTIKNSVIMFIFGFAVASIFFVIKNILDNTVKDGAAVCEEMDILLLAEIPDVYVAAEAEKVYAAKVRQSK